MNSRRYDKPITRLYIGKQYFYDGPYDRDRLINYVVYNTKEVDGFTHTGIKDGMQYIPLVRVLTLYDFQFFFGTGNQYPNVMIDFDEVWEIDRGRFGYKSRRGHLYSMDFLFNITPVKDVFDEKKKEMIRKICKEQGHGCVI